MKGEFIGVAVTDTGCGMTPEQIEKIFFPFYTTKRVGKGTGLGLSVSYGIIKSMGGRIEVSSEVGRGSTFEVLLPLQRKS
jgi:two-component system NtrC family sensor kinase